MLIKCSYSSLFFLTLKCLLILFCLLQKEGKDIKREGSLDVCPGQIWLYLWSLQCYLALFTWGLNGWYNYKFVFDLSLLEKVNYTHMFTCRKTMWSLKSWKENCARNIFLGLFVEYATSLFHLTDLWYVCVSRGDFRGPFQPSHLKEAQRNHVLVQGHRAVWWQAGTGTSLGPIQCFFARRCCWACNEHLNVSVGFFPPSFVFLFHCEIFNHFRIII